jgi:hypothetical protein
MFKITEGVKGPTITLTRGDYASFHIDIFDEAGGAYELKDDDIVTFTVKRNTRTEEALVQKNGVDIEIFPEDTENLRYGTYSYDVQLTPNDNHIDTFIGPADFVITEEVTF